MTQKAFKMFLRKLKAFVPRSLRPQLRHSYNQYWRRLKAPQMRWGFQDANGEWRPRTRVSDSAFLQHQERIHIADNVFVWHYTILDGTGTLHIGEGSQIGAWVGIFTHSSHLAVRLLGDSYQRFPEEEKAGFAIKGVSIGRYVFIGAGAKILPGVSVGDGALISATAVVSKDVAPFEVVAGNPARVIGDTRKLDKPYLDDPQVAELYREWRKSISVVE